MRIVQRIKNGVRDWLIGQWLTGGDDTLSTGSTSMSQELAMKYSAVHACVRVLAETFAVVPAKIYRSTKDGGREEKNDISLYDILHNAPNDEMSPFDFATQRMVSLNTGGYSVCQRLVNYRGELVGLYPIKHENAAIRRKDGKLVYNIRGDDGPWYPMERSKVFHVLGLSYDGITGLSPIEYMANTIALGLQYERFSNYLYKNNAASSGAFSVDGELSDTAYERLKRAIAERYQGLANTGKPLLLEGGMKYQGLTINPVDAQLIESKRFQIEDICRCYRVPLHLVQNLERATNNNIEHQSLEFVMYSMLPWFKRDEAAMRQQLLTKAQRDAGYYVEYKMDALLRGDAKSRAEAYAAGRQWGWLSVNDIRRLENLSPIENGDIYLQPSNMFEAGQVPSQSETAKLAEQIQALIERR